MSRFCLVLFHNLIETTHRVIFECSISRMSQSPALKENKVCQAKEDPLAYNGDNSCQPIAFVCPSDESRFKLFLLKIAIDVCWRKTNPSYQTTFWEEGHDTMKGYDTIVFMVPNADYPLLLSFANKVVQHLSKRSLYKGLFHASVGSAEQA
jgi:hypothetical protein